MRSTPTTPGHQRSPGAPSQAERRRRACQNALSKVEPARRASVIQRANQVPSLNRLGYLRAILGQVPPRVAIKAHCLECCGWERHQVARCTSVACPLWAYRPSWKQESDSGGGHDEDK